MSHYVFESIMLWELILRVFFVNVPAFITERFKQSNLIISYFFVYVMLQALAILWGFLQSIGAVFGSNMISILTMPLPQTACVLVIYSSVIGLVLSFGRTTWILTWQSLHDFPFIRRMLVHGCRPQSAILVAALPMLLLLCLILVVPSVCYHEDKEAVGLSDPYMKLICEHSFLQFLTNKYPVFQRSLRLSTSIAMFQFVQACLAFLPKWRHALADTSFGTASFLLTYIIAWNAVGIIWFLEWLGRHFQYAEFTPLSRLSDVHWELFGTSLWLLLLLWVLLMTSLTYKTVRTCQSSQRKLAGLFQNLKLTFVFGQAIIFCRACMHPNMGFVHAQLELTIINLILPSIYVVALIFLRVVTLASAKSFAISFPLAIGFSSIIYRGSRKTERPHSFVVVSLFTFCILLNRAEFFMSSESSGKLPSLLARILQSSGVGLPSKPTLGHQAAKVLVFMAFVFFSIFVTALIMFSILSVVQKSKQWYPDATSVSFENNSIIIEHTAIVKLDLKLAGNHSIPMQQEHPKYASCTNLWHGLSLVDFALLSQAAYLDPSSDDVATFVSKLFDQDTEIVEVRLPPQNTKTGSRLDFYEVYMPKYNTSVISVKGTDIWRFTDFVEDLKMFFEPVIFNILSTIFPTIRIWPDVTFSTLIELYHELISLFGLEHDFWYYHELVEYTNSIKDRNVILTGHSMGGAIARIVASILKKQSVTFSPPGLIQSYSKLVHTFGGQKYKVERSKLHQYNIAVIPEYDPITLIDVQAGLIQKISCATPHLSMQLSCHMLEGTLCNLLEHCGDHKKRIAGCVFTHTITSATKNFVSKFTGYISPNSISLLAMLTAMILSIVIRRGLATTPERYPKPQKRRNPTLIRRKSCNVSLKHRRHRGQ
uniref:Transmembrane protein putative n=1 Tax=Albugo laibachii Nc14 TaxID=890382 RepID=F0VYR6_9STRA|nr:transmembrane protein putative [Albugo laibachii Nc14]|eukprot:CCA13930.1 transmembrane protein putative [Albugo laibachii Nc14]